MKGGDDDMYKSNTWFGAENVGAFDPKIPLAVFCESVEKEDYDTNWVTTKSTAPDFERIVVKDVKEETLTQNNRLVDTGGKNDGKNTRKNRKKKKKKKKKAEYWIKPTPQKRLVFRWEKYRWGDLPRSVDPLVVPPEMIAACGPSVQQTWEEKFVELQRIPMRSFMCPPLVYPVYLFLMIVLSYILGLLGVPVFMFLPLGYVGDMWTVNFVRWIDDFNQKLPRGVSVKSQTLVNGDVGELSFLSFALDADESERLKHEPHLAGGSGLTSQFKEPLRLMPSDWHRII